MKLTVEVYKRDGRKRSGERLINKFDHQLTSREELAHLYGTTWLARDGYRFVIVETYVTRTNMMSGTEFQERYDTPYYCSPSSETYWST